MLDLVILIWYDELKINNYISNLRISNKRKAKTMRKHAGFTLAEVLITLGIIGVVAAMTIPTLMSNTGKSEFKTAFKKILSVVNQAVTMSVALDYLDFGDADAGSDDPSIYSILSKRMHIVKAVGITHTTDEDKAEAEKMGFDTNNFTWFFSDGMVLSYDKGAEHCTNTGTLDGCSAIIDVNGLKNPNKLSNCNWDAAAGTTSDATSDDTADGGRCTEETSFISDQFSVIFKGQQLLPNGYAARFVLYEK